MSPSKPILSERPEWKLKENHEPKSIKNESKPALACEFVRTGLKYVVDKTLAVAQMKREGGLKNAVPATLEKPVLMVQGFKGGLHQFTPMVEHLEASGNGSACYVKDGKAYADRLCTELAQPSRDSKIFHLVHGSEDCPETVADDIQAATQLIKETTDSERPDIIAHSMGGLATRVYTDKGGKIGKMALVGTPNKGSRIASLTRWALGSGMAWAASLSGISAAAIPALKWMEPTESGNEKLTQLNRRWDIQERNTKGAVIIGAGDFKSPSANSRWERGDGLIEESRLAVGDLEVRCLKGKGRKSHFTQLSEPDTYREINKFLGWNLAESGG